MKEVVVLSGKGGTGKTSVSAALAMLAPDKVLADCDVDAANLHLVVGAAVLESHAYTSGFAPEIDAGACRRCGHCTEVCRFGAIAGGELTSPLACEGCGVCAFNCPAHAIMMRDKPAGHWMVSQTRFGRLVHAELGLAIESSGKLVSQVRREAKKLAEKQRAPLIITDGPPGIGCPVIAAITGADLVLAVVEPSVSAMHDLARLVALCRHFRTEVAVCINKATLNSVNTNSLLAWCDKNGIAVIGRLPYSEVFRAAAREGRTVLEMNDAAIAEKVLELWHNLARRLDIPPEADMWHKFASLFRRRGK